MQDSLHGQCWGHAALQDLLSSMLHVRLSAWAVLGPCCAAGFGAPFRNLVSLIFVSSHGIAYCLTCTAGTCHGLCFGAARFGAVLLCRAPDSVRNRGDMQKVLEAQLRKMTTEIHSKIMW
jgi:hypothetical protein